MATEVTTAARYKLWAAITGTDAARDLRIGVLVTGVSSQIETYLNREMTATAYTEYFDVGSQEHTFHVRGWPVTTMTTIHNDSDSSFGTTTLVDSGDYRVDLETGDITFEIALETGPRALKVVYTGGMAADTAAFHAAFPDIELAADYQINHLMVRQHDIGLKSVATGGTTVSFQTTGLLQEVKDLLGKHKWLIIS